MSPREHAAKAKDGAAKGVEGLARFGYAAKGLVYMLVGVLAIQVAAGVGGQTTDPRGALTTLVDEPFGQVLLAIIAIGLLGYAIWRFVEAGLNPEHDEGKKRVGYALSGAVHLGLAFTAASLAWPAMGGGGGGGGGSTQDWTARLMSLPWGQWLVGIVGAAVIGYGLYEIYRGYEEKFMRRLKTEEMDANQRKLAERSGKAGLIARGITFAIIGGFLIVAAVQAQPQEARGLSGALATLAAQPFGQLLLGLVALGLIAYGVYQVVMARFRRIAPLPGHA